MVDFQWINVFRNKDAKSSLREKLHQNILFKDLRAGELRFLENIVNLRSYRPGEVIFRQGEVGVGMYIILSGHVNIQVEEIQTGTLQPKSSHVTVLKAGEFFGELALVEEEGRRSATASAQNEAQLIGFYKPDLIEIIERSPSAGVKILMRLGEVLGVRLRQTTARITELKTENLQ
jgi:CRP/FNR family cyclic AMP-dependent transcriptional regulator